MSHDTKVAYVWGIGDIVGFERGVMDASGPQTKSFLPLLIKGLQEKTINQVVRGVDAYYEAHPGELQRPVVDAIFRAVVLPGLSTTSSAVKGSQP